MINEKGIWFIGTLYGLLHSLLVRYIYKIVPDPYMDEIFHVDQTRRYCAFNFTWNPKITTPPALYLLSVPLFCGSERYINSAIIPFAYVGCIRFRQLFRETKSKSYLQNVETVLTSTVVLLLPVLFHSSLLYYTDLLSITSLVWATTLPPGIFSTIIFALSICTRQTNIIWGALYGFMHLSLLLKKSGKITLTSFIVALLRLWSLLLLPISFVIFFLLNNRSIVLGDHSAHQPVAHFMQIFYFLLFFCFSSAPLLVCSSRTYKCLRQIVRKPIKLLILYVIITCCVYLFTYQHPYLLADNRHLTFYIWRRWFLRHSSCRYLTVILYIVALNLFSEMIAHVPRMLTLLYILGTIAVLAPVHLLEMRYFIIPFALWRLSYPEKRISVIILELLYEIFLNVLVLYLFLFRSFEWPHERGVKQRFMW